MTLLRSTLTLAVVAIVPVQSAPSSAQTDDAAGFTGRPPTDEAQRRRRILSVDRTGNVAAAKVELDYPQTKFTDSMALAKIGTEWKIVNKLFVSEPKAPAPR